MADSLSSLGEWQFASPAEEVEGEQSESKRCITASGSLIINRTLLNQLQLSTETQKALNRQSVTTATTAITTVKNQLISLILAKIVRLVNCHQSGLENLCPIYLRTQEQTIWENASRSVGSW